MEVAIRVGVLARKDGGIMRSFYWLIENALAGCGRPGATGHRARYDSPADEAAVMATLDADLDFLRDQGIGAVLTLTETPLAGEALQRAGLESLHIPITDMAAPTPLQFEHALSFIDEQRGLGRRVAVHCLMGQGRTGSILTAYLIRAGATPEDALARLRAVCPGAVENPTQERALQEFARRRDWII
jgi:atypical dual specificity phosphatase